MPSGVIRERWRRRASSRATFAAWMVARAKEPLSQCKACLPSVLLSNR